MSILNNKNQNQLTKAQSVAKNVKFFAANIAQKMFRDWSIAFDMLWAQNESISMQEKIDALGTDAAEIFLLNESLTAFMIANFTNKRDDLVEQIQQRINAIPEYTINQDGTVTLN